MRTTIPITAALLVAAPALGHHSDAGIDMDAVTTIEGVVTEFHWRNPHVYLMMEAQDAAGETVEWQVQMGSTTTSMRRGWTRDAIAAGDRVTVGLHPARNGRPYGILESLEVAGGAVLSEPLYTPRAGQRASSIEGVWMAERSDLAQYPGGYDGFFRAKLELTEQGAAAQAAYDEFSEENPESRCVGRPTPGMIISSHLFPMQIEIDEDAKVVFIRSEIWDEERTVHLDGRGHPAGERYASGHSIGWWEGQTLVVDTANFTDHRSPYQIGVPSGARKHVVERYRLNEDGTRLLVEFTLEDPEYIAEPAVHERSLIHTPELELLPFECDPEATRRFLSR